MAIDILSLNISSDSSIREALAIIDSGGQGIALSVDGEGRLKNVITDGDMRRAILAGTDLDAPLSTLPFQDSLPTGETRPITAALGTPEDALLRMMNQRTLRHIPLVDQEGRVRDIAMLSDLAKEYETPISAMIMAGGYGTRLRPLTDDHPKPMLPVGDKPLMEHLINQLCTAGIRQVNVATHYKSEVISDHFGDGKDFGVEINYIQEGRPLGTAGGIGLLSVPKEPLLVINGDILTRVDFRAMLDFHREHDADMTVAVREYEIEIPYGLVETNGVLITGISEKPVIRHFINGGIYLLDPVVCSYIPPNQHLDMPELITTLVADFKRVVSFPIHEYWLDIGRHVDYQNAQSAVRDGEV